MRLVDPVWPRGPGIVASVRRAVAGEAPPERRPRGVQSLRAQAFKKKSQLFCGDRRSYTSFAAGVTG